MNKKSTEIISVPISPAELIDKITILEIKAKRIQDQDKLKNIRFELGILKKTYNLFIPKSEKLQSLTKLLREVNGRIWDIEDKIRLLEKDKKFDSSFVKTARSVYVNNDKRSIIKKKINLLLKAGIKEEKSYENY